MATQFTENITAPISRPGTRRRAAWMERGQFAVLANRNARGFARASRRGLFDGIPSADLYVSRTIEESESMVREIVEAGYDAVFAAGGDGTVAHLVNTLRAVAPSQTRQPRIGVLRMGTGNALASFTRTDSAESDVGRLLRGTSVDAVHVPFIECEGMLTPFAGCGADAGVLNDYIKLKSRVEGTLVERALTGVRGYLAAGILKTVPGLLTPGSARRVFVVNDAPIAYAVNQHGDIVETFGRGEVLYSGKALMAAVGAIPFYGYDMKMFPAANRLPGHFQVRVAQMNPLMVVPRLPGLWRGELGAEQGIHDFLCSRVRFEFDGDVPFHISGDAAGSRREVTFAMSQRPFEFVRPVDGAPVTLDEDVEEAVTPLHRAWV